MKYFIAMYYDAGKSFIAQALVAANSIDEAKEYAYVGVNASYCGVTELTPDLVELPGVAMFERFIEEDVEEEILTGGFAN